MQRAHLWLICLLLATSVSFGQEELDERAYVARDERLEQLILKIRAAPPAEEAVEAFRNALTYIQRQSEADPASTLLYPLSDESWRSARDVLIEAFAALSTDTRAAWLQESEPKAADLLGRLREIAPPQTWLEVPERFPLTGAAREVLLELAEADLEATRFAAAYRKWQTLLAHYPEDPALAEASGPRLSLIRAALGLVAASPEHQELRALGLLFGGTSSERTEPFFPGRERWDEDLPVGVQGQLAFSLPLADETGVYLADSKSLLSLDARLRRRFDLQLGSASSLPERIDVLRFEPGLKAGRAYLSVHRNEPAVFVGAIPEDHEADSEVEAAADLFLSAIDTESGQQLWSNLEDPQWQDFARQLEHLSSPLAYAGSVFAVGNQWENEVASRLFCLDALDGSLRYSVFLGSSSQQNILARSLFASPPSASDGMVYAMTNNGVISAVEAHTGRVLWSFTYPLASKATQIYRQQRGTTPLVAPLVAGPLLICFPRDAESCFALERWTGKRVWTLAKEGELFEPLGVSNGNVVFAGSRLLAVELQTGLVAWEAPGPEHLAGRGLLSAGVCYVPGRDSLLMVDAADGSLRASYHWSPEQAGHLALAGTYLYSVSPTRICAFESLSDTERRLPRGAEGARRLAGLRRAHGRLDEALALLRGAVNRAEGAERDLALDDLVGVLEARSDQRWQAGNRQGAGADLAEAGSLASGQRAVQLFWRAARRYEEAGELAAAVASYQQLAERFGDRKLELRDGLQAPVGPLVAEALQRLVRTQPELYRVYALRAREALSEAEKADSAEGLRRVVQRFPASREAAFAQFGLAQFYMIRQAWPNAAREWQRFLRLFADAPRRADALAGLVRASLRGNFIDEATHTLERLLREHPNDLVGDRRQPVAAFAAEMRAAIAAAGEAELPLPALPIWRTGSDLGVSSGRILEARAGVLPIQTERMLFVRRLQSGDLLWQRAIEPGALCVVGDSAVALFTQGAVELRALESGRLRWRFPIPQLVTHFETGFAPEVKLSALTLHEGRVFVGTRDERLWALDGQTGVPLWQREQTGLLHEEQPVFAGMLLCYRMAEAALWGLDPLDGSPRFHTELAAPNDRLSRSPSVSPARIFCVAGGRRVLAFDQKGEQLWEQTVERRWIDRMVPSADGKLLAVLLQPQVSGTHLQVLASNDGRLLWEDAPGEKRIRSLSIDSQSIYIGRGEILDGEVHCCDRDSGFVRWIHVVPVGISHKQMVATASHLLLPNVAADGPARVTVLDKLRGVEVDQIGRLPDRRLVAMGLFGSRLVLLTDRGSFAFGQPDQARLEERVAQLLEGSETERDAGLLEELASCYRLLGDERAAIRCLADALQLPGVGAADSDRLLAQLMVARELASEEQTPVLKVSRVPRPVEIDGELTDWWREQEGLVLNGPEHLTPIQGLAGSSRWLGAEDLSATLYLGWDERYFYLTIDVRDNILRPYDGEADSWIGDCLLIALDPQNNRGAWFRSDDQLLSLALTLPPKKKPDEEEEPKAEGKFFVTRKDDNSGVVYEVRLAWSSAYFREAGVAVPADGPKDGFSFGFDFALTDDDHNGATKVLCLTPGLLLHTRKDNLWPGFIPKHFGTIRISRDEGRQP